MMKKKNHGLERSMEEKKDAVSKNVWMIKKNHGFQQSMENKKMLMFQRKYG